MGLRVWLPLNGSLENQGLSTLSITNSGATVDTAGKVGSCYSFNGSSAYMRTAFPAAKYVTKPFSVAFWVYFNNVSSNVCICSSRTGVGYGFSIFRVTNYMRFDNGTNSAKSMYEFKNYTFSASKWYHVVCVQTATQRQLYVDGVLRQTADYGTPASNTAQYLLIGASGSSDTTPTGNYLNGKLNDFRLYDHALSVKEVRELARGLMVHYKLDSPEVENTTNYAFDPHKDTYSSISPGWDTTKHIGAVSVNNWGPGYNGGVPDPSHGYHAMWNVINGTPTIVFQDHNSEIGQTHRWLGLATVALPSAFLSNTPAGTQYCISFDMKTIDTLGGKVNVGVYYKKTSSSSNNFYDGNKTATANTLLNTWERKTLTFTRSSEYDGNTNNQTLYVYGHYGSEATMYVRNVQLEIKDHSTPYTPSTRTASKVVDCSGFRYHGTIQNTLATIADTPRYDCSTSFPGTSYIKRTSPSAQAMTISLWAKWNSIPSGQSVIYVDYKSKTGLGLMSAGILCSSCGLNSYTFSKSSIVANTWYHFVIVCPSGSSNAARDLYINGVKQTATTNQSNWSYAIDELQLGKRSTTSNGFNGKLSDFRIYATALSEADIMDLYHTSAEIDRDGNYYSREVIEK